MKSILFWLSSTLASNSLDYVKWVKRGYSIRDGSGADEPEYPSPEELQEIGDKSCADFYIGRGVAQDSIHNDFVTNGGQGAIFRCWTETQNVIPEEAANKVYFMPEWINITEVELINTAVNATGVRPVLYKFHDQGYIEEWLG